MSMNNVSDAVAEIVQLIDAKTHPLSLSDSETLLREIRDHCDGELERFDSTGECEECGAPIEDDSDPLCESCQEDNE